MKNAMWRMERILDPSGSSRGVRGLVCVFGLEGLFVELNVEDRFNQPSLFDQLAVLKYLDFVWHQCVLDRLEIFEIDPVFNRSGFRVFVVGVDDTPGLAADLIAGSRSARGSHVDDVHLKRPQFVRAHVFELRAVLLVSQQRLITVFMGGTKSRDRILGRLLKFAVLYRPRLLAVETDDIPRARQFQVDHQQVFGELRLADEFRHRLAFLGAFGGEEFDQRSQRPVALYAVQRRAAAVIEYRAFDDVFRLRLLLRAGVSRPDDRRREEERE